MMATFTAVLKVPDGMAQDDLLRILETVGGVVFLGPDNLVDEELTGTAEPFATEVARHTVEIDGLSIDVVTERTQDGPRVRLEGKGVDLEGDMPGEYYLRPVGEGSARMVGP